MLILQHRKHLMYITDLSNILTLAGNQNIFRSKEGILDTFPSLSLYQVKHILESITPEKSAAASLRNIIAHFPKSEKTEVYLPKTLSLYDILRLIHPKDTNSDDDD
jgi:hypothetical protein